MKRYAFLVLLLSLAFGQLWPVRVAAQSDRARQLGFKIKCMCRGCDMSAGGCSHPGGAFSGPCDTAKTMLREVDQHIAKGESDEQVLQAFVQQYGAGVYMEPPKKGIGLVAWLMPVFYAVLGTVLVLFVIGKWRKRPEVAPAAAGAQVSTNPKVSREALETARAQAARETED